jgi:hypothetical protein
MKEEYITITGSNQKFKLLSKTAIPFHKVQLVVEDSEGVRFVFTRQAGCYIRTTKPVNDYTEES